MLRKHKVLVLDTEEVILESERTILTKADALFFCNCSANPSAVGNSKIISLPYASKEYRISNKECRMIKYFLCHVTSVFDIPCSIFDIFFLLKARSQPIADIG
jgi:hypothetical protein